MKATAVQLGRRYHFTPDDGFTVVVRVFARERGRDRFWVRTKEGRELETIARGLSEIQDVPVSCWPCGRFKPEGCPDWVPWRCRCRVSGVPRWARAIIRELER
jgi:hypothetical protein